MFWWKWATWFSKAESSLVPISMSPAMCDFRFRFTCILESSIKPPSIVFSEWIWKNWISALKPSYASLLTEYICVCVYFISSISARHSIKTCIILFILFRKPHEASPYENSVRINPIFQNDDGGITQLAKVHFPLCTEEGSSQVSEQGTFQSIHENIHVSIEVKSRAYASRIPYLL